MLAAGLVASHEQQPQPFTPTVIVYDLMTLRQRACLSVPIPHPMPAGYASITAQTDPLFQMDKQDQRKQAQLQLYRRSYQWPLLFVPKSSNQVLTATGEGQVIVWRLEGDGVEPTPHILAKHEHPVVRLCVSPDGSFVASSSRSYGGRLEVHELSTGRKLFFGRDVK